MVKVGIVGCSNGLKEAYAPKMQQLEQTLVNMGVQPVFGDCIYEKDGVFSGSAEERANALMKVYMDAEIREIFDISGGDVANGVLPYLNYHVIAESGKRFWGYSDMTTVINAIYAKTGKASVLYQIRNLISKDRKQQIQDFCNTVLENGTDLFQITYHFVQGKEMQGIVVGGNIRCFLKLAGTEYMPDLTDKILLLEANSGTVAQIETYLCQLQQLGAFEKIAGILLGTFTQMETEQCTPDAATLVRKIAGCNLPVAVTKDIGHGTDAKAIVIGQKLHLKEQQRAT